MKMFVHISLLLAAASIAECQTGIRYEPCPDTTAGSLGCELIAWTMLQQPNPTTDSWSLPNQDSVPSARLVNVSNLQEAHSGSGRTTIATMTMVGVVVRRATGYFLKFANTCVELDNPAVAQHYEGQRVRITGVRIAGINAFHLQSIDPD